MSIKRKIFLSFIISASIITSLVVFEFYNYVEMRNEIRFLELTDTIRSKSLQLRRHEKNFFLYSPQMSEDETMAIRGYMEQLRAIIDENLPRDRTGRLIKLDAQLEDYSNHFEKIKSGIAGLNKLLDSTVPADRETRKYYPLIELTFVERPLDSAMFLEGAFGLPHTSPLVTELRALDTDIRHLRKNGESIIEISKELDKAARAKVDGTIAMSQKAILIFFPLFLLVGAGTLFLIAGDLAVRLVALTKFVETAGKGGFNHYPLPFKWTRSKDELGVLVQKFKEMGDQLAEREHELSRKNEELLQTKKLAAIGTLASGVAHELNNPLNNIYLSAQVLKKKTGDDAPPVVREVVDDIVGQTARVKRIVGDLLEYARMKEPETRAADLCGMINRVYRLSCSASSYSCENVGFSLECPDGGVFAEVDPDQMDRVFINLMSNALDAMRGKGELDVLVRETSDGVEVAVSDTGEGIEAVTLDKIFEPFYTTKDRGTGLGLAISYNIVKRHGGEITVVSEKGRGTTMTVRLPRKKEA
jgi:two-component system, NtrC family, sensor kinase